MMSITPFLSMRTTLTSPPHLIAACVGVILLFASPCFAQKEIAARIDSYVKAEMQRQRIPGVSLAVVRRGKIALVKSYGFSNVEHRVAVKPETVFQSSSIGKQFTAAAVMILIEEGKLSLDDRITKYFTDAPESWKNITVRHLLTHTSGKGQARSVAAFQRRSRHGAFHD